METPGDARGRPGTSGDARADWKTNQWINKNIETVLGRKKLVDSFNVSNPHQRRRTLRRRRRWRRRKIKIKIKRRRLRKKKRKKKKRKIKDGRRRERDQRKETETITNRILIWKLNGKVWKIDWNGMAINRRNRWKRRRPQRWWMMWYGRFAPLALTPSPLTPPTFFNPRVRKV